MQSFSSVLPWGPNVNIGFWSEFFNHTAYRQEGGRLNVTCAAITLNTWNIVLMLLGG